MRAHEVGDVGDANRLLAAVLDGFVGAERRERLDRGRVLPAAHDSPRLVVSLIRGDRAADSGRLHRVELHVEQGHVLTWRRQVGHRRLLFVNVGDGAGEYRAFRVSSIRERTLAYCVLSHNSLSWGSWNARAFPRCIALSPSAWRSWASG